MFAIYLSLTNWAVQLIEFDCHAHLISKAGFLNSSKSPSPVFRLIAFDYEREIA